LTRSPHSPTIKIIRKFQRQFKVFRASGYSRRTLWSSNYCS